MVDHQTILSFVFTFSFALISSQYWDILGIAGLVVWYLASGAQGPRINTTAP